MPAAAHRRLCQQDVSRHASRADRNLSCSEVGRFKLTHYQSLPLLECPRRSPDGYVPVGCAVCVPMHMRTKPSRTIPGAARHRVCLTAAVPQRRCSAEAARVGCPDTGCQRSSFIPKIRTNSSTTLCSLKALPSLSADYQRLVRSPMRRHMIVVVWTSVLQDRPSRGCRLACGPARFAARSVTRVFSCRHSAFY